MTDYRVLIVDYLWEPTPDDVGHDQTWYSWFIRTYDAGEIEGMLRRISGLGEESQLFTRVYYADEADYFGKCPKCHRVFPLKGAPMKADDENWLKCPLCHERFHHDDIEWEYEV